MLRSELDELVTLHKPVHAPLSGRELTNAAPRTLLLGTTAEGFTHHVYLDERQHIRVHVYGACRGSTRPGRWVALDESEGLCDLDLVPKRLEPQYCDAEFCRRLQARKWLLPFSAWEPPRADRHPFAGERIEASSGAKLRLLARWSSSTHLRAIVAALSAQAVRFRAADNGAVYIVDNDRCAADHALGLIAAAA
jgi:hypothetical protein